jgi:hypothetical protein
LASAIAARYSDAAPEMSPRSSRSRAEATCWGHTEPGRGCEQMVAAHQAIAAASITGWLNPRMVFTGEACVQPTRFLRVSNALKEFCRLEMDSPLHKNIQGGVRTAARARSPVRAQGVAR